MSDTSVQLTAAAAPGWEFSGWSGDLSGNTNPETIVMTGNLSVTANFTEASSLSPGDVIISSMQAWNDPAGQSPGEFIELFNTTDQTISLAGMQLISRVDNNSDGVVDIDWQLSADLTGKEIAPHSFFLVAESGVAAPSGLHDVATDMDLATGEGGVNERAISVDLVIDGMHMDYLLYGYRDDPTPGGELPAGDITFDGTSWPRTEVIRNTRGGSSYQEGLLRRETASDLFAGYAAEGYYTDEDLLAGEYPQGIWTSPHDHLFGGYEARNSLTPAVTLQYTLTVTPVSNGTVTLDPAGGVYDPDTSVQLTAAAAPGWEFSGWSGDLSGSLNPETIVMDGNKTVTATFTETATDGWTAYNDCVYEPTHLYIGANVTTYGIGGGFGGATSGELLRQTGAPATGVIATLTQSGGVQWQPSETTGGADTAVGTDAYNTFFGYANMRGVVYYGAAGWYVDLTFTGLDPAKQYTFATSASRGGSGGDYPSRKSIFTLNDANTYTNASTSGVDVLADNAVAFVTGTNYSEGYVARWTGITAGPDGSFSVRAEADDSQSRWPKGLCLRCLHAPGRVGRFASIQSGRD